MSKIATLGILLVALGWGSAFGQAPKVKRIPARSSPAVDGVELFRNYCAVCHGADARGGGPAAPALKEPPADLTRLAARQGGKYPELHVQQVLAEETDAYVAAHGSADMPIWGAIFRRIGPNPDLGAVRIYNLVKYLETLQVK